MCSPPATRVSSRRKQTAQPKTSSHRTRDRCLWPLQPLHPRRQAARRAQDPDRVRHPYTPAAVPARAAQARVPEAEAPSRLLSQVLPRPPPDPFAGTGLWKSANSVTTETSSLAMVVRSPARGKLHRVRVLSQDQEVRPHRAPTHPSSPTALPARTMPPVREDCAAAVSAAAISSKWRMAEPAIPQHSV